MSSKAKFVLWIILGFAIGIAAIISGAVFKILFNITAGAAWIIVMIIAVATGQLVAPPGPEGTIGVTITFSKWYVWLICALILGAGIAIGLAVHPSGW